MPLPKSERAKIEAVPLWGPRTADFLEMIGPEHCSAQLPQKVTSPTT